MIKNSSYIRQYNYRLYTSIDELGEKRMKQKATTCKKFTGRCEATKNEGQRLHLTLPNKHARKTFQ